jgi:DNA-binding beta-propeller fold protein YncE
MGVALAPNDVLYVADAYNHAIRSVSPGKEVGTYAGTGVAGNVLGERSTAQFFGPSDIAVASDLTMYVTDTYNYQIKKIDPLGKVIVLAGSGIEGYRDGPGKVARFALPLSLALGPDEEHLYVADYYSHRIRRIDVESDQVSTVTGNRQPGFFDGAVSEARLNRPAGIEVGSGGTIYFSDSGNHAVRMIRDGQVTTLAGDGEPGTSDGNGDKARFNKPYHLALSYSETFLYITDWENHLVRRMRVE